MTKLSKRIRDIIYDVYSDNMPLHNLLQKLESRYLEMKPLMEDVLKCYKPTESEIMLNKEIEEIANAVLVLSPSNYLKSNKCYKDTSHKLLTQEEVETFYMLYRFQERLYKLLQHENVKKYIDTLVMLEDNLCSMHPYTYCSRTEDNETINKTIMKVEYESKLKNNINALIKMNEEMNIKFDNEEMKLSKITLTNSFKDVHVSAYVRYAFGPERNNIKKTIAEIISVNKLEDVTFTTVPDVARMFAEWRDRDFD